MHLLLMMIMRIDYLRSNLEHHHPSLLYLNKYKMETRILSCQENLAADIS